MRDQAARVIRSIALLGVILLVLVSVFPYPAQAAINNLIGFQGKLTNPDGTNVADNTYSILFNIYSGTGCTPTGGAPCASVWNETQSVTTVDGIFQVNLGASTALPGSVDFNLSPLYLSLKVGSDPEMSPRILFTAAPYAMNSAKLGGLDSNGFVQLAQGLQTDSSATNASIAINKTGATANILDIRRNNTPEITVDNTGAMTLAQLLTGQAGASITGGVLTLTGNAASSLTTSAGALTITSNQATTWSTANGNLTLQAGSGTVSLGTTTSLTAGGGLTVTAAAANALTLTSPVAATWSTTAGDLTVQAGSGTVSLGTSTSLSANGALTIKVATCNSLNLTSPTAPPTVDQVVISNAGQGVTTAGVSGLEINYVGGNMAVEASGERIDLTPGATANGIWNGLRIVANGTGAVANVTENGIKLNGPATPGAGTEVGMVIDANWDAGLQLGSKTSDPGVVPADNIYLYARKTAGRSLLEQKGPSGVSFAYQPALFEQSISMVAPTATAEAVSSYFSNAWAASAPGAGVAPTSTEAQGYTADYPTTNTAGSVSTIGQNLVQWIRGSTAGSNGFFYVARLLYPDASYGAGATGARIWNGLTNQAIGNIMTNTDNPAGNYAGFQYSTNRGDVNWQFMTKDNVTQNPINTNMAFTIGKLYDFYIYTPPQGTTIYWRIDNLTDGTTQEGNTAANLPTSTVAMRALASLQTLTTTGRNWRMAKIYVEADR
jgi:hypothetical protein